MKVSKLDCLVALGLMGFSLLYTARVANLSLPPFEDAAMLMRYAQNVAGGHGIVWNPGERPVDGATDFVFMLAVSVLIKAGMGMEAAARGLLMAAHVLSVGLVYLAIRSLHGAPPWAGVISALYLAMGVGNWYISTYFAAPFFSLIVGATWWFANRLVLSQERPASGWLFAAAALLMGLARPDGVFMAGFMLLGILCMTGLRRGAPIVGRFCLVFGMAGGAYFLWRWSYFGHLLPTPFHPHGGGRFNFDSLHFSMAGVLSMAGLFLPFFALVRSTGAFRYVAFSLVPICGFTALWVLMGHEVNFFNRYQYPILAVVLISWPFALKDLRKDFALPHFKDLTMASRVSASLFLAMICIGFLGRVYSKQVSAGGNLSPDGRYDTALMLGEYRGRNYTLVTSEAGLLPLYSGWRTIDSWGVNDPWIVANGRVTKEYLDRYHPEVIMFSAYFSPLAPQPRGPREWLDMTMTLKTYAEERGYVLAAAFGTSPHGAQYYYVRGDFPDALEITRRIRETHPYWHDGQLCVNFAKL